MSGAQSILGRGGAGREERRGGYWNLFYICPIFPIWPNTGDAGLELADDASNVPPFYILETFKDQWVLYYHLTG